MPAAISTTERKTAATGGLTMSEIDRRHVERLDQRPMTVGCAMPGCDWPGFEGTAEDAREAARLHREEAHPGVRSLTKAERKKRQIETAQKARAERDAASRAPKQRPAPAPAPPTPRARAASTPSASQRRGRYASWTREQILAALFRWAEEHDGTAPSQADWSGTGGKWPSPASVGKQFGGWLDALAVAGLEPRPPSHRQQMKWTPERVDEEIRRFYREHGRAPMAKEMMLVYQGHRNNGDGRVWAKVVEDALAKIAPFAYAADEPTAPQTDAGVDPPADAPSEPTTAPDAVAELEAALSDLRTAERRVRDAAANLRRDFPHLVEYLDETAAMIRERFPGWPE